MEADPPKPRCRIKSSLGYLSPKLIYKEVDKNVIGQYEAKKVIANLMFLHVVRYFQSRREDTITKKSNALLMGPTGCGKTFIVRETTKAVRKLTGFPICPLLEIDCTELTPPGWVGDSIRDIISKYAETMAYEPSQLASTVIFLDEFDKLCKSGSSGAGGVDLNRGAQYNILKLMEGLEISASGRRPAFDTSSMLFILAGNFSEIRSLRENNKKNIGFMRLDDPKAFIDYHTELDKAGMVTQLVGRTSQVAQLDPLNQDELLEILNLFTIPDLAKTWKFLNKRLKVPEDVKEGIIERCFARKTGARGLETDLTKYVEDELFEMKLKYRG